MRAALLAAAAFVVAALPGTANAFPWTLRHGYSTCAQCHADPSGGGVLTAYGRAQGEVLLRTPWGKRCDDWEPGPAAKPLFGLVELPQSLDVGFSSRSAQLVVEPEKGEGDERFLQMQTDLRVHARVGQLRVLASLGYADETARPAQLTKEETGGNAISREHWVGWQPRDALLIRGGRIMLPFGIRQIEHTLWIRQATRTDITDTGQHGLAVAWTREKLRTEVMAIAGNFQVSPDEYRERGYSGFAEWTLTESSTIGFSSKVTHAEADLQFRRPMTRGAHGVFTRFVPLQPVTVLAEVDFLHRTLDEDDRIDGYASIAQVDVEAYPGVHLVATAESLRTDFDDDDSLGAWLSLVWYFAPHVDVRVDAARRSIPIADDRLLIDTWLFQFHFYL